MKAGTRGALVKGAAWIAIARILTNLIGIVSTIILARLLAPSDFGLVAIASALAMIIATITELSLYEALIQHDEPDDDHYHTVFSLSLLRSLILSGGVALLAWPAAAFYNESRLFAIVLALAFGTFVGGMVNPKLALFERKLEFRQWVALSVGEKLSGFVVAAVVAVVYQSYWALVLSQVVSQCARTLISYMLISYRPRLTLRHCRDLLSFSIWLTLGQAVQAINWRSDPLLLGLALTPASLGQFSVGGRLANLAISEVLQPVAKVLFPAFARLKHDLERLRLAYLRSQGLLLLLSCPVALGLLGLAKPITLLLIGAKWQEAIPAIQILALAGLVQRFSNATPLVMATGHTRQLFGRDVRALVVRMPLILAGLFLAPQFGITPLVGATSGIALSSAINALWNMQLIGVITPISFRDQLRIIWRPLAAAAAMCGLLLSIDAAWILPHDAWLARSLQLSIEIGVGALAYTLFLGLVWLISGRPAGPEVEAADLVRAAIARLPLPRR